MAYRRASQDHNPLTGDHYGNPQPQQQQYRNEFSEGYNGYNGVRYNDSYNDGHYEPYGGYNAYSNHQPHQTYEQGGYTYNTGAGGYQDDTHRNTPSPEGEPPVPPSKENSTVYEHDDQMAQVRPRGKLAGSQKSFKDWRTEGQGNLWTRGSRTRTCGRFFCCTFMITAFLIISILLSLALWVEPPNITVSNPTQNSTQSFTFQNNELAFNLAVNITVDNPNYFGVALNKVELDLFYPISQYPVGGGEKQHINIRSNAETNFTFPFSLNYNVSNSSSTAVLQDIVNKCRANQDLTVNYALKLSLRIAIISVSPTITNSFRIKCPIDADEIEKLLGGSLSL